MILACVVPVREGFPSEQESVLVGFAQDTLANDWRLAQVQGVEQAFSAYPHIRFIYTDGKGSTAKQIRDIEDMINRGVDILITSPRDSRAMTPVISRAYRQGIPVILLTRKIETGDYTTFIAPDDAAIARDAAAFMAAEMQGQGRIFMLQGLPSASTAILRTNAFLDELRKHEGVGISVIKTANYLRSDAIKAVEEVLQQNIPFDAIYAQSDSMASGARIALKKAGVELKNTVIVGIDYISEARTAIRNGEQRASYIYPTCAREAVEAAVALSRGETVARAIKVPSQRVTRDNVDKIAPIF
jgi:ribose transport system substrate-binding protein